MKKTATLLAVALATIPFSRLASADVTQPLEIIERPRTLPAGELELQVQLLIDRIPGTPAVGTVPGTDASTATGLGFLAGYGFTPQWEGFLGYNFGLSPSSSGDFAIGAGYNLGKLGAFTAAFDIYTGFDTNSSDLTPLLLGLNAQIMLGDTLALFTPGKQLTIGLAGDDAIGLNLPIILQYQAAPNVFVDVGTNIAYIGIKGGGTGVFGSDFVPVQVDLFYSVSHALDFGVFVSDDLKAVGDTFSLGLTGRVFI